MRNHQSTTVQTKFGAILWIILCFLCLNMLSSTGYTINKDDCRHTYEERLFSFRYIPKDDESHQAIRIYHTECTKCGYVIIETEVPEIEPHSLTFEDVRCRNGVHTYRIYCICEGISQFVQMNCNGSIHPQPWSFENEVDR